MPVLVDGSPAPPKSFDLHAVATLVIVCPLAKGLIDMKHKPVIAALTAFVLAALTVGVFAGAGSATSSSATATKVTVAASEFKFVLSKKRVPHGTVTFVVTNRGSAPHDFKIKGKKTALLGPGKTAKLKVVLPKGKFAYLCTVPGHAAAGMKGVLTVT